MYQFLRTFRVHDEFDTHICTCSFEKKIKQKLKSCVTSSRFKYRFWHVGCKRKLFNSTNALNILEMTSANYRANVHAQINKSTIDGITLPETNLSILPNRHVSIYNTTNHNTLQYTNNNIPGSFSNSTFSGCVVQFTHVAYPYCRTKGEAHSC